MKKKYVLYPGYIKSKNDNDLHFITGRQLMELYAMFGENFIVRSAI